MPMPMMAMKVVWQRPPFTEIVKGQVAPRVGQTCYVVTARGLDLW